MTAAVSTGLPVVPVPDFAVRRHLAAVPFDEFFRTTLSWVAVPTSPLAFEAPRVVEPTTELTRQLARVVALTGWSSRDLQAILGASHTTVLRFRRSGMTSARSQQAALLVRPLLEVLERLAVVLPEPTDLNLALARKTQAGVSARELFARERWAEGYAAVLSASKGARASMLAPKSGTVRRPGTREIR